MASSAHLSAEFAEPLGQSRRAELGPFALLPVGGVEHAEIAHDAGIDLFHPAPDRDRREVAVSGVDRAHAATVHRHRAARDEPEVAAEQDKAPARRLDADAVIVAEVGDGLEVGCELSRQPHQFDVASRLAFQAAARLHLVEIAVDIELEHRRRMVARPSRRGRAGKAQKRHIQLVDEQVDHPDRIIFGHIIVDAGRQENLLSAVTPLDETTHTTPPDDVGNTTTSARFHTASTSFRHSALHHHPGRARGDRTGRRFPPLPTVPIDDYKSPWAFVEAVIAATYGWNCRASPRGLRTATARCVGGSHGAWRISRRIRCAFRARRRRMSGATG